ncbi:MAG TPA: glycosyltransferase family 4 protein [Blastocatellia bacterium]
MDNVVAFISGRDPAAEISGGHSSYVRAHARGALRAGYTPHIFCAAPQGDIVETEYGVIHRIASPVRPVRQLMVMAYAQVLATEVERFLTVRPGAGLIHSFGVWGYVGVQAAAGLHSKGRRARTILSSYTTYTDEFRGKIEGLAASYGTLARLRYRIEDLWARWMVERFERDAYLRSNVVAVNYESVTKLIRTRYGASVNIVKVPYTCESAFLDDNDAGLSDPVVKSRRRPGAISLVSIARSEPNKGTPVLLAALAAVRQTGAEFSACIVGDGRLLESHRRLADKQGLTSAVTMTGAVPDVIPYLREADVFVLPSLSEGSGSLALIEAMQMGLPIVASAVDGIVEDLEDGRNALLVSPGDVSELSGAISKLAADPVLRSKLGHSARARFLERFSAEAFSKALGQLYSGLADMGGSGVGGSGR